jgi:hypothetical protein
LKTLTGITGLAVSALAWRFAGPSGLVYLVIYAATLLPGLPIGFALFGRRHAAGWVAGALCGYALTSLAIWTPLEFGWTRGAWTLTAWAAAMAATWTLLPWRRPMIELPGWQRRDTAALLLTVSLVPLLVARPFSRIGEPDADGNLRYRAYFTADFLWHVALTAELSKGSGDPRNPYLARRPLHYYWAYFVIPSVVDRDTDLMPSIASTLKVNAMCAGLLFVAALFVSAWCAVPRAVAAASAVVLTVLASSAEGLYAIWDANAGGRAFETLRHLNIDAITSWVFQGLTVDALPRSIWYTPQHAAACALGLMALLVPAHGGSSTRWPAAVLAGVALGLALTFSPFLGGTFCVIYGLTAAWASFQQRGTWLRTIATYAIAAGPVLAALGWCLANRTFDGAGGHVAFGLSRRASSSPFATLALTLGPALLLALPGLCLASIRSIRLAPSLVALGLSLAMFYGVTLTAEPVWVGWRAGQIMLVTIPALAAAGFAALRDRGLGAIAVGSGVVVLLVGLPTTLIDLHNAQDVANLEMGPGFRWTVSVAPDSQAALQWLRTETPPDAVVQMSIKPRGRETWTLVPTFAERRLAAGMPISLLQVPEYSAESAQADSMFTARTAAEAARVARAMRIDYVYVDRIERQAFGAALDKFDTPEFFNLVFEQGDAAIYQVR